MRRRTLLAVALFSAEVWGNPARVWAEDQSWRNLSLREKIGQTMILCHGDPQMEKDVAAAGSLKEFLKKYPVSGVFLASWNINGETPEKRAENYRRLVEQYNQASSHPMFFQEDFEQGVDFAKSAARLPTLMALGATDSPKLAYESGKMKAQGAKEIGVNWVLNPVADLNINPLNALISTRAASDDPQKVVRLVGPMVQAMNEQGVVSTIKHFPGDGVDFRNQHIMTTSNSMSQEQWKKSYGEVYRKLIQEGAPSVMVGHISLPAFQKKDAKGRYLPASLSPDLINGVLKGDLGFKGVAISDALNMGGIHGYYPSDVDTQVAAFQAGIDVLLWPDPKYMDVLEQKIRSGEIPMSRLDDAVSRVWAMKEKFGLLKRSTLSQQPADGCAEGERERALLQGEAKRVSGLQSALDRAVGNVEKPTDLANKIAEASITLVRDENQSLPLKPEKAKKLLLVLVGPQGDKIGIIDHFNPMLQSLKSKGFQVDVRVNLPFYENEPSQVEGYDKVIFAFNETPYLNKTTLSMGKEETLTAWFGNSMPQSKVISVSFGDPRTQSLNMPLAPTSINAYSDLEESQKAAVRALTGEIPFRGVSPVNF